MDKQQNKIIECIDNPSELERLYRSHPKTFEQWFDDAALKYQGSETIKVWGARLSYQPPSEKGSKRNLILVVFLSMLSGMLVKLPEFINIPEDWFYLRFTPIIMIGALAIYFAKKLDSNKIKWVLLGSFAAAIVIGCLYPYYSRSASLTMSQIHLPLVLLSFLAIAFMGNEWRQAEAKLKYIRYIGEVVIYTTLILLGGIVLTLLTLGLFRLIDINIDRWYFNYVVVFGLVASPIVATYLYDSVLGRKSKLATLISNVFSPLFLVTVFAYLIVVLYLGKSPYTDRDFLIMFNGLLVIVWAITVFSIAGKNESNRSKLPDVVNVALISVTLVINAIALSAIVFRLSEYGITVNRIVVAGENLLIFIHLLLILKAYIKYIRANGALESLNKSVADYLPVYSAWSLFVAVILPLLFSFR